MTGARRRTRTMGPELRDWDRDDETGTGTTDRDNGIETTGPRRGERDDVTEKGTWTTGTGQRDRDDGTGRWDRNNATGAATEPDTGRRHRTGTGM